MKVGLSPEQVPSAVKGDTPDGLSDVDAVNFDCFEASPCQRSVRRRKGHVAEGKLGKEGAAHVAHAVAWSVYSCTLLNLGAVDIPSDHASDVA